MRLEEQVDEQAVDRRASSLSARAASTDHGLLGMVDQIPVPSAIPQPLGDPRPRYIRRRPSCGIGELL
jgi:hypothetical protein